MSDGVEHLLAMLEQLPAPDMLQDLLLAVRQPHDQSAANRLSFAERCDTVSTRLRDLHHLMAACTRCCGYITRCAKCSKVVEFISYHGPRNSRRWPRPYYEEQALGGDHPPSKVRVYCQCTKCFGTFCPGCAPPEGTFVCRRTDDDQSL